MTDVVVIGAGIVGAACAYYAARAGLAVTVVDRGPLAGGTTSAGEGNILLSDKLPGPELDLGLLSYRLWRELDIGPIELEPKGGLMIASTEAAMSTVDDLATAQRASGVDAIMVSDLAAYEPRLRPGLPGGAYYPQDLQVQPMLATARLLRAAPNLEVHYGHPVTAIETDRGRVVAVRTAGRRIPTGAVVNAAGVWAGEVAGLAGVTLPIAPRRGFVLVTEPLPPLVRYKVATADYLDNVASGDAGLQASAVVEGTPSGTILIGASRERVGFDRGFALPVLRRLAAQAIALFPFLAGVRLLRAYRGFRPYSPDHLPMIGPDPRVAGLFHACGHEGAGIGLSQATGRVIAAELTGAPRLLDLTPFRPERFA
ncbi:MAG TPA: FAD-binding oxidoreductase [Actinophytocola sp.]|uniref:NAD(P)/FAD-dependent oxidoreductase n=1 Tax=Actinophytocola sp. TaxID=1872138 RepID=UPI002DB6BCC5|nr:FAD-binding oxidoreductase [Actinophytocola sp.]HEU5470600.1 FAD-binding oxidoreductase [Actinophytocola sp.]